MIKRIFQLVLIALIALLSSSPATAAGTPGRVYLDTTLPSNGDGTITNPYNNLSDAVSKARSFTGGAWIYERPNGYWVRSIYISPVVSGGYGLPLPTVSLYILLAIAALVMAVAGLQLRRRSRQLQH